jgi:hypothetical protein
MITFSSRRHTRNRNSGFIALISTIIIATVLMGLALTISGGSVFARLDALHAEYKRISLGLADSCSNVALLRIGQNYNYTPAAGGDLVTIGQDAQGRLETCTIESVAFPNGKTGVQNTVVITSRAQYPSPDGANSRVTVSATVQDPTRTTPSTASSNIMIGWWGELP